MTTSKLHFSDIRYNPELSGFQARATIKEGDVTYVYPVHLCASLNADFHAISKKLLEKARQMHANRRHSLHMRSRSNPAVPRPWAA